MRNPSQKKFRGISGVVVTVLLTVIGIAAVLMFWGMMSGFFNPHPKVIIESAQLTNLGNNQYDLSITVRETGGASTCIIGATITGGDLTNPIKANSPETSPFQTSSQHISVSNIKPTSSTVRIVRSTGGHTAGSRPIYDYRLYCTGPAEPRRHVLCSGILS